VEPRRRSATSTCSCRPTVEDLTVSRHAAAREDYLVEAEAWRKQYAAENGWKDPPKLLKR
jgi:hypothetical protein